jgi:hypothetical protein
MRRWIMVSIFNLLILFFLTIFTSVWVKKADAELIADALAGRQTVTISTQSGIDVIFGMNQMFHIDWAHDYDFYKKTRDPNQYTDPEGLVRNEYWAHQVYFPISFSKKDAWRAHMVFSYKQTPTETQFYPVDQFGVDNDRWRVERAYFEFKLPFKDVNAWLGVGHDGWVFDYLLIYGDDDPGIRFYGNYGKFSWDAKYIRKSQQTNKVDFGYDSNRNVLAVKLKYELLKAFNPELFFLWDKNNAMTLWQPLSKPILLSYCPLFNPANPYCQLLYYYENGKSDSGIYPYSSRPVSDAGTWNIYYAGIGSQGIVGPIMYIAEFAYQGGSVDIKENQFLVPTKNLLSPVRYIDRYDVNSYSALLYLITDLGYVLKDLNKFVVSIGGVYFKGDDNPYDKDLEGFVGSTSGSRFFPLTTFYTIPVHGGTSNPVIGTPTYAWNPTGWGIGPGIGGLSGQPLDIYNVGAHGDNPGLLAGVFTIDWFPKKELEVKLQAKYLRWDTTKVIETQLGKNYAGFFRAPYELDKSKFDLNSALVRARNTSIDKEIGWELNGLVAYDLYREVTLYVGGSILFPGDGPKDINYILYGDRDADPAWHIQFGVRFIF